MPAGSPRPSATLLPFPVAPAPIHAHHRCREQQKRLMDAVFATGVLEIAAADVAAKRLAARLQILGFVAIDEVGAAGRARRLRPSESISAAPDRPWRLSRAGFGASTA